MIGLSFYNTELAQLNIMLDVIESKDYELLKRGLSLSLSLFQTFTFNYIVILQIEPTTVLTSSKQDDTLEQVLTEYGKSIILIYTVLYCTILYYTDIYCTILYYTDIYSTILIYTVLYCTILIYTVLYCTILIYTLLY